MVVLEGLAGSSAVIASDIPGYRYAGGDAPMYVPPGDVAAWAAAFDRLLDDDTERQRLAARGPERARAFDWLAWPSRPFASTSARSDDDGPSARRRDRGAPAVLPHLGRAATQRDRRRVRRRRPDLRHRRDRRGRGERGAVGRRAISPGTRRTVGSSSAGRPERAARHRPDRRDASRRGRTRGRHACRSPPRRSTRDATLGDVDDGIVLEIKTGTLFRAKRGEGVRIVAGGETRAADTVAANVHGRLVLGVRASRPSDDAVGDRARGADRLQRRDGRNVRSRLGDVSA